jgi:D-alanyl-D-alanine dipeptidase
MQKGIGLQPQVFDVVLQKVIWELNGRMPEPAFLFKRLLTLAAQIPSTGTHMSGSAIDISVLEKKGTDPFSRNGPEGASQKMDLSPFFPEVDRGGPYLEMSERTPMNSPFVSPEAQRNRQEITAIMRESGFLEYPYEFWHYDSGTAAYESSRGMGRPARYGAVDLDVATGQVTPIEKPQTPLNSLEQIQAEIQAAMDRCVNARVTF